MVPYARDDVPGFNEVGAVCEEDTGGGIYKNNTNPPNTNRCFWEFQNFTPPLKIGINTKSNKQSKRKIVHHPQIGYQCERQLITK